MMGDHIEPVTAQTLGSFGVGNHDTMKYLLVQQELLILCLTLVMQEGGDRPTPAGLHLHLESATMFSLPKT